MKNLFAVLVLLVSLGYGQLASTPVVYQVSVYDPYCLAAIEMNAPVQQELVSAYPNPFNSTVTLTAREDCLVTIFNAAGQVVDRVALKRGVGRMWGKGMSLGVYVSRISNETIRLYLIK